MQSQFAIFSIFLIMQFQLFKNIELFTYAATVFLFPKLIQHKYSVEGYASGRETFWEQHGRPQMLIPYVQTISRETTRMQFQARLQAKRPNKSKILCESHDRSRKKNQVNSFAWHLYIHFSRLRLTHKNTKHTVQLRKKKRHV